MQEMKSDLKQKISSSKEDTIAAITEVINEGSRKKNYQT